MPNNQKETVPWNDRCPYCRADRYMSEEYNPKTGQVQLVCNECGYTTLKGFGKIA